MEQLQTLALDPQVSHGLMRDTLKVQFNDDSYVGIDLDEDKADESPPKRALGSRIQHCNYPDSALE